MENKCIYIFMYIFTFLHKIWFIDDTQNKVCMSGVHVIPI